MAALVSKQKIVLSSLRSKGQQEATCTCPVGASAVLTSLNRLKLQLDKAVSKFLKKKKNNKNLEKHLTVEAAWSLQYGQAVV